MDIIEGVDEIKDDLEGVEGVSDDVVGKLDELKMSSEKVINSLKGATSESEDRKNKIKTLNEEINDLNSAVDGLETDKEDLQESISDKTSRIANLEMTVKEHNLNNKKELKSKFDQYKEHEKFGNIKDFLKFEQGEDEDGEFDEVIKDMEDEQVAHDLNKLKEYEAAGLFAEGTKQKTDQFTGGTGEDNLIEEIQNAKNMDELNKIKRKVEKSI